MIALIKNEFVRILKKNIIAYSLVPIGAIICFISTSFASLFYSTEPELMWCLRIIGVFIFIFFTLIGFGMLVFNAFNRYYSTVIGDLRYRLFALPLSVEGIIIAKMSVTSVCILLYLADIFFFSGIMITLSANLNFIFTFLISAMGKTDYVLSFVLIVFLVLNQVSALFYALYFGACKVHRSGMTFFVAVLIFTAQIILVLIVGTVFHFVFPYVFYWGDSSAFFSRLPSLIVIGVCAFSVFLTTFLLCGKLKKSIDFR